MDIQGIVYILTNIFMTFSINNFMKVFFENQRIAPPFSIITYICYLLITSFSFFFINIPLLNLVCSIVSIFIITYNYHSSITRRISTPFIIYAFMFIADVLAAVVFGDFRISPTEQSKGDSIFMLITMSLILYFESLIAKNFKGIRKNNPASGILWLSSFAIPLSSIFIAVIVLNSTNTNQITITVFVILIFAINLLTFYLHDSLSSAYADQLKFKLYEQEKNYYYNQCELMAETMEETKSYRHDIKNHLSTANNFIKSSNFKEASEYLSKLIGEVNNNNIYSETGNIAFDSIINYKLRNANDNSVDVQVKVVLPSNLNIDVIDVITIMGNLLDNAINATMKTERKNISLALYYDKGRVFIKIENTYNGEIKISDNEIVSLSAEPEHGYGLKNVKKSVDKYNGLLDISYTDKSFMVDVLLYIKQDILQKHDFKLTIF